MAECLLQCYNKSCGKKFKEEENCETACTYHPGNPVFHDALKGWSCCRKRTTDFTDFLSIPGCTVGRHNPVKPPEPEAPVNKPLEIGEEIVVKASPPPRPKRTVFERPSDDLPYKQLPLSVSSSLRSLLQRLKLKEEQEVKQSAGEEEEDTTEEISVGTRCKNKGCEVTYQGNDSDFNPCHFHPGFPIFHEGYKFWSCCQRRTSDFNEFLKQQGCRSGDHVWTESEKKDIICRHDWHQTGNFVMVSIFAKACVPDQCSFYANPTNLQVAISSDNGKSNSQLQVKLHGVIDPERSSVELLGTKAEIKLRKAVPMSWKYLQLIEKKTETIGKEEEEEEDLFA